MDNLILHKADTRGHVNHGWLDSYHSFSFAGYYNPRRMHFGAIRVLNDDCVMAGRGFDSHPHDNMEIISIPLEGELKHRDNTGTSATIKEGDVQVMSAGSGITHSEYNASADNRVKFLQIWIFPDKRNVQPRYGQAHFSAADMHNRLLEVVSPGPKEKGVWIHQSAWLHMGNLDAGTEIRHKLCLKGNGIYALLLSGEAEILGQKLESRDGMGITEESEISIRSLKDSKLLLIEVPMAI
jgi:redox-sensitive bicupin YhaK (pirin superfamily)